MFQEAKLHQREKVFGEREFRFDMVQIDEIESDDDNPADQRALHHPYAAVIPWRFVYESANGRIAPQINTAKSTSPNGRSKS